MNYSVVETGCALTLAMAVLLLAAGVLATLGIALGL